MKGVYLRVAPWTVLPISETIITEDMRREGYRINKNPYITVVPEINSNAEYNLPEFEPVQRVSVGSIEMKPSVEKPIEISLDISDDMVVQIWRDELFNQISEDNVIGDTEELHIKLVEIPTEEDPMTTPIDNDVRNDIVERVSELEPPSNVIATHLIRRTPEYMKTN